MMDDGHNNIQAFLVISKDVSVQLYIHELKLILLFSSLLKKWYYPEPGMRKLEYDFPRNMDNQHMVLKCLYCEIHHPDEI